MSRPQGIVETRPRAEKPPMPRHTLVTLRPKETADKWLIFNHAVYCIGTMYPGDYEKWVRSHAKSPFLLDILTTGIDDWGDSWAKWYAAQELLRRGKIVLYDSKAEAERAMRRAG